MPTASGTIRPGAKSAIGAAAVQILDEHIRCVFGVLVKAAKDNSGIVYVGRHDVTAGSADATDGIELAAGDAVFIEIDNIHELYAIASAAGQKVFFIAI